ncbi:YdbL family protein [Sphingomonas sp.]
MRKTLWMAGLAAVAIAASAVAAHAVQRDPAYAQARAAGQVGEQIDGYLGIVGSPTPELRQVVNDINIRRKAAYTRQAGGGATIEQMAFVSGCNLIARTEPGEMYQAPDGSWKKRGSAAPERDPRCV